MMKKIVSLLSVVACVSMLAAQTMVSTQPTQRNVLIEEYTGVGCQYCPLGHKATDFTLRAFPGHAFAINIHTGVFATRFTTTYGNNWASQANIQGYPSATLNRHVFGNSGIHIDPGQSFACALKMRDMASPVNVAASVDIDPESRLMVVKVEAYYPGNGPGDFNLLNVALLQNNVLGQQAGASSYYPENMVNGQYRHNHILRHLLTGQWGDTIHHTEAGSLFVKEYAYVVPNTIGDLAITNFDDLSVLVFVCQDRTEVLNVCEAVRTDSKAYIAYGAAGGEECSMDYNPYVEVVNPTGKAISNLRLEVDGQTVVRAKTIAPYCKDTVVVNHATIADMPASHQLYGQTTAVKLVGYTTDGAAVDANGSPVEIHYADADIYTAEGPLTMSIAYDAYPQEVSFTLAGIEDCRFYYERSGAQSDVGNTVSYTLSPRSAGLYRLKLFDTGADGLDGTVTVTDASGNTLFSRNARDLYVWDNIYFNISTEGTDGPRGTVVGIDEVEQRSLVGDARLWPNPVGDELHIEVATEIVRAEIMDVTGRLEMTTVGDRINVSSLPAGLHIVRLVTLQGIATKKFIKQ